MAPNTDDEIPELPRNDPPELPPARTARTSIRSSRGSRAHDEAPARSRPREYSDTFLQTVRSETCYATLRKVVDFVTVLSIVIFAIGIVVSIANISRMIDFGIPFEAIMILVFFVLGIVLTIAGKQATILFVDIADILIWNGKRQMRNER